MHTRFDPSLNRLATEAKRYPMLTSEREHDIASLWRQRGDRAALDELVGSHLRLVMKIARGFAGYGLPLADLVAEGNIGLLQAAYRFDPERGSRFATYAVYWIRAAIQEHILHSWSMVKIGTTQAQKRLFFNLRRAKARLQGFEQADLGPEAVATIAQNLDVTEEEVIDMNQRLAGPDYSLNSALGGDEPNTEWLQLLPDERPNAESAIGEVEEARRRRDLFATALKDLTPREREIIGARRLGDAPITLNELASRYNVSRERVRQIEIGAVGKLRKAVVAHVVISVRAGVNEFENRGKGSLQ
jgi:RNA polymerase sigma-32 factor